VCVSVCVCVCVCVCVHLTEWLKGLRGHGQVKESKRNERRQKVIETQRKSLLALDKHLFFFSKLQNQAAWLAEAHGQIEQPHKVWDPGGDRVPKEGSIRSGIN